MTVACRGCGSERIAADVPLAPGLAGLLGRAHGRVCADCGLVDAKSPRS